MKGLFNYLKESLVFEKKFSASDFDNPAHTYAADVINALCNNTQIKIGPNGEDTVTIDPKIQADLKKEFDSFGGNITVKDFNEICKKYNLPVWTNIFKGDFSGYSNGSASGNKGNAFEVEYVNNFHEKYQEQLEKDMNLTPGHLDDATIQLVGGRNTLRPLRKIRNNIVINDPSEVGDAVVDALITNGNERINVSLKIDKPITLCNIGVGEIFSEKSFKEYAKTGVYTPGEKNGVNGKEILDLFGLNPEKFASVFINYIDPGRGKRHKKSEKDEVDVTKDIDKNGLMELLKSIIGYNLVLTHNIKNKIYNHVLMNEKDLNKFIGNFQSAVAIYPNDGKAKRVEVKVETTTLKLTFVFRTKRSAKVYPDAILCEYDIKH